MNKFLKLSTFILSAAALLATACENSKEPQHDATLKLELNVGEVTSTSIAYTITPSIADAAYCAELFPAEELASERDIAVAATLMTLDEAYCGTKSFKATDLSAERDYKILYFGYDSQKKSYTTDYLVSDAITTADFEIVESIDIEVVVGSVTWRDIAVSITPSSNKMEYIFDIMEKSKWDALSGENPEAIVAERIKGWEQDVIDGLESNPTLDIWQKYMQYYQHSGAKSVAVSEYYNLRWATEYVMYAFGMNDEGLQTTNVVVLEFKTDTPEPSQNTFSVEIGELTASTVAFSVTTTNDDPYFLTIQDKRYVDRFGEGKAESWEDMIWDITFVKTDDQIRSYIFNGSQTLTNADISKTIDTLHEYQVVIWGFYNGPTTAVYVSDVFQPADAE